MDIWPDVWMPDIWSDRSLVWSAPFQISVAVVYLYLLVGPAAFAGVLPILKCTVPWILCPIQFTMP